MKIFLYQNWIIRLHGYKDGEEVKRYVVSTTKEAKKIQLKIDDKLVENQKVYNVEAHILDEDGCVVPTADNEITFSVVGGIVLGIDNGKSDSHQPFKSNKRKANAGMCLAVVKRTGENMRITATADGIENDNLKI